MSTSDPFTPSLDMIRLGNTFCGEYYPREVPRVVSLVVLDTESRLPPVAPTRMSNGGLDMDLMRGLVARKTGDIPLKLPSVIVGALMLLRLVLTGVVMATLLFIVWRWWNTAALVASRRNML
jgi:hypothetical protein